MSNESVAERDVRRLTRRGFTTAAVIMAVLGLAVQAHADQWPLDLSIKPGRIEIAVQPGQEASILILNWAPFQKYNVATALESIPIPPLPVISFPAAGLGLAAPPCAALVDAGTLAAQTDEQKVAALVTKITLAIGACTDLEKSAIAGAIATTRRLVPGAWVIHAGEQLTVTVSHADDPSKQWVLVLSTGARGTWRTLYGVSLVSNQDERFFAKATDTSGKFAITRERVDDSGMKSLKPIPSVFYSWLSHSAELKNLSISPSLGLGLKDDAPGFFFGASITYNQNIGIVVGVPVYQQSRLKGSYTEGQIVSENLTGDQLHDKPYRLHGIFVAGVFRFASNPFAAAPKPAEKKADSPAK